MEGDNTNISNQPTTEAAVKPPLPKADKYIWAIFISLLVISIIELYSASSREVSASNVFEPIIRHGSILFGGALITWGLSRIRYTIMIPVFPLFCVAAVLFGVYVLFNGDIINGARRSATILGIALQPAEFLKLSVVLFIAQILSKPKEQCGGTKEGVILCGGFVLVCCGLLYSQGLTNTILLTGISIVMMVIGGIQWKKLGILIVAYALLAGTAKLCSHFTKDDETDKIEQHEAAGDDFASGETIDRSATQINRIKRWLGEDSVPKYAEPITSENRQEQYSYMAQANGGIFGKLPGNSREAARLPLAFSDYIYAIVVEDWGLIGGTILLLLYLTLLARAGAIASRCTHAFPSLLVMGMSVLVVLQAIIHISIVTGMFPVSGQPLPLISKGGSSILSTCIAFGLMLSVSRYAVQNNNKTAIREELHNLPSDVGAVNATKLN